MHACSHVAPSLFKKFSPHSDGLKDIGAFMTELFVTKVSYFFALFFAYFTSLVLALSVFASFI